MTKLLTVNVAWKQILESTSLDYYAYLCNLQLIILFGLSDNACVVYAWIRFIMPSALDVHLWVHLGGAVGRGICPPPSTLAEPPPPLPSETFDIMYTVVYNCMTFKQALSSNSMFGFINLISTISRRSSFKISGLKMHQK